MLLNRRLLLRQSAGLIAVTALARPHIAKAQGVTATVWFAQGFIPSAPSGPRSFGPKPLNSWRFRLPHWTLRWHPLEMGRQSLTRQGRVHSLGCMIQAAILLTRRIS